MPQLAENDATFGMNRIYHALPCLHLFLIVYPGNMGEPDSTPETSAQLSILIFVNQLRHQFAAISNTSIAQGIVTTPCDPTQCG